jgi:uracil-DNA glycosylase
MKDKKRLGEQILGHLKLYDEIGVRWLGPGDSKRKPSSGGSAGRRPAAAPADPKAPPITIVHRTTPSSFAFDPMPGGEALETIRLDLKDCRRCKLSATRKNIVFGSGNPNAELMFVGEAPGADEDEQGLPFVGRAGQLLTKIIEAIEMQREEVFICNILKCRPPGNRDPDDDEIAACEQFLWRQIASVKPKVICALGAFGAQTLLGTTEPISKLRGQLFDYRGVKLMPTFHPAYLLRNPIEKRKVWEDVLIIREYLRLLRNSE